MDFFLVVDSDALILIQIGKFEAHVGEIFSFWVVGISPRGYTCLSVSINLHPKRKTQ